MLTISSKKKNYKNVIGMEQVHGNKVCYVDRGSAGKIVKNCDGLITSDENIALRVDLADCLPVFIFDPTGNNIGLVHAGWRGLYKGVIPNAINLMKRKMKIDSRKLIVFIGPHICRKHYEIKEDLKEKFENYPEELYFKNGKIFLDMAIVAKTQLLKFGIKPGNITISNECTFENKDLFSYRKNKTQKRTHYLFRIPD